jgi:hypothetical protein
MTTLGDLIPDCQYTELTPCSFNLLLPGLAVTLGGVHTVGAIAPIAMRYAVLCTVCRVFILCMRVSIARNSPIAMSYSNNRLEWVGTPSPGIVGLWVKPLQVPRVARPLSHPFRPPRPGHPTLPKSGTTKHVQHHPGRKSGNSKLPLGRRIQKSGRRPDLGGNPDTTPAFVPRCRCRNSHRCSSSLHSAHSRPAVSIGPDPGSRSDFGQVHPAKRVLGQDCHAKLGLDISGN